MSAVPRQCAYLEADALAMVRKAIKKFSEEFTDAAINRDMNNLAIS